jgi:hypothetical protein
VEQTRVEFLRDRSARSMAVIDRALDWRFAYVGFLITGLGTLGCLIAQPPWLLAVIFVAYVVALLVYSVLVRQYTKRKVDLATSISTEVGPPASPASTRDLPRYMLTAVDAENVPMLDSILVVRGDDLAELHKQTKRLRRGTRDYTMPFIFALIALPLALILIFIGIGEGLHVQVIASEISVLLLAVTPAFALQAALARYERAAIANSVLRVTQGRAALMSLGRPDAPFTDGIAIRLRNGDYVVDGSALVPPAKDLNSRRNRRSGIDFVLGFVALPTVLAVATFILHPISGILVR